MMSDGLQGAAIPIDGGKLAGVPPFNVSSDPTLFSRER